MATRPRLSKAAANAAVDAVTARLSDGWMRLYDGAQPASADAPVTSQTLLAELRWGAPAFKPAEDGTAEAHPILDDESANGGGKATWFRASAADGSPVFDGSVGESDATLIMRPIVIQAGTIVRVPSFTYTQKRTERG